MLDMAKEIRQDGTQSKETTDGTRSVACAEFPKSPYQWWLIETAVKFELAAVSVFKAAGIVAYTPMRAWTEIHTGCKHRIRRHHRQALFPGYAMAAGPELDIYRAQQTRRQSQFIGIIPIVQQERFIREMTAIASVPEDRRQVREFVPGRTYRVCSGALLGSYAKFERTDKNGKAKVYIETMGQWVLVDIDTACLERI